VERARELLAKDLGGGAKQVLRRALAALARREYGRVELERKLQRDLHPSEHASDVSQVLDRLQAKGLLSDQRMAQSFVRTRAARYGRLRIEQELLRRGLERSTVAEALTPAPDELSVALALWRRKFGRVPTTAQERARQGRYLAARGFDASIVARIVSGAIERET
jgi:regulatory protein